MKTINDLCDIVRQTAYHIHVYHGNVLSQGNVSEEGLGRSASLVPFLFAFSAFFRG